MRDIRVFLGALSPILTFSLIGLAIFMHPWFDWNENALSDLGARDVENGWVFNLALILGSVSAMAFASYLIRISQSRYELFAASIFTLSVFFMGLIGVFPEGHPVHWPSAVLFYILAFLSMLAYGLVFSVRRRIYGPLSIGIMVAGILLMAIPGWTSLAIPETIGALSISAWIYTMVLFVEKGGIEWTTGTE